MINAVSLQKVRELEALHSFFLQIESSILELGGADRYDFINRLSTNLTNNLKDSEGVSTILTNEKGKIIDILNMVNIGERTLCFISINNSDNVIRWLKKYLIMDDVRLGNCSDDYSVFEVHGEHSLEVLRRLSDKEIEMKPMFHSQKVALENDMFAHVFRIPSSRTIGFKVLVEKKFYDNTLVLLRRFLTQISSEENRLLEILHGTPGFGTELTSDYNPLEAGLLHLVNFKKGCYIGQEVIARLESYNKVKQHIVGLKSKKSFNENDEIHIDGKVVGKVTSVVQLLGQELTFGLGYVRNDALSSDETAVIRDCQVKIVNFPIGLDE